MIKPLYFLAVAESFDLDTAVAAAGSAKSATLIFTSSYITSPTSSELMGTLVPDIKLEWK